MKNLLLFFALSLLISSCSKSNDSTASPQNFKNVNGTEISISNENWYTKKTNTMGEVHLILQGNTNADSLKITNSGDGLVSLNKIALDVNKKFDKDLYTSFTASIPLPTSVFQNSVVMTAYKGTDIFEVTLTSGNLKY